MRASIRCSARSRDFDALVARAHALGLKVIIDQVYSHSSDQHAWFQESRSSRDNAKADWYVWADAKPDGSPPNNWQSVFGGPAWTWDARRGQYYLHNFLPEQPDLNLHNPAVQDALLDVARFWLDRGVDGFRHRRDQLRDARPASCAIIRRRRPAASARGRSISSSTSTTSRIPTSSKFLERLRAVTDRYGDRFTRRRGRRRPCARRDAAPSREGDQRLNSAYGFDFLYAEQLTPELVARAMKDWPEKRGLAEPGRSRITTRRARSRAGSTTAHREAFARMKMLLLCALRGSIIIYQGEELGLPQVDVPFERLQDPEAIANWPHTLSRDGARTPMPWAADAPNLGFSSGTPWLPLGRDTSRRSPSTAQEQDGNSMLAFARELRRAAQGAPRASDRQASSWSRRARRCLVFDRSDGDQKLRCTFNLSSAGNAISFVRQVLVRDRRLSRMRRSGPMPR